MILVRAEEHVLVAQLRVASGHLRDDVHRGVREAVGEYRGRKARVGWKRRAERRLADVQQGCAAPSRPRRGRAVGIEAVGAARERERHALPVLLRRVGHEDDDRRRRPLADERLDPSRPGAQRVRCARPYRPLRGGIPGRRGWKVSNDHRAILDVQSESLVRGSARQRFLADRHRRRVDLREHDRVGDDVLTHAQRRSAQRDRAAGGHAETFERKELEVGAVVPGRLQTGFARALRDPSRCRHLVERAALAAAHLVAGQREQIGPDFGFADPLDRIPPALRAGGQDEGGNEQDCESDVRAHAASGPTLWRGGA